MFCSQVNMSFVERQTHTAVAAKTGKNSIKFPGWGDANFNQCYRFFFFFFLIQRSCVSCLYYPCRVRDEGGRADIIAQERSVQLRQCCITYNLASNHCTK